jgi:hypothetical protein
MNVRNRKRRPKRLRCFRPAAETQREIEEKKYRQQRQAKGKNK